jgi:hypothetical protein
VLFLHSDEGEVFKATPAKKKAQRATMSNRQYFNKLAEAFIAEVSRVTPDGMLFRVDMRLRPEGDAGPLCRSLASYENYYTEWGQTWERMMLIKARGVAGDESLAAEFLEMIQPFRFPPSLSADVLREVAAVKDRIEKDVVGATSNWGAAASGKLNSSRSRCKSCMPGNCPFSRPRKRFRASPNSRSTNCWRKRRRNNSTPPTGFSAMSSIACKWRKISRRTRFPPTARRN